MNNSTISDIFSLLSKLSDIHGENSFKSKSYSVAAFSIDKYPEPLIDLPKEKIATIKGIGASSAQKIFELFETGRIQALEDLIAITPSGILQMMKIKGLGPKKINTIWKEMEIETVGELLYACKENRLKLYKGFGEKTQQAISDSIEFFQKSQGRFLFAQVIELSEEMTERMEKMFGKNNILITGDVVRQNEIVDALEYVIAGSESHINFAMEKEGFVKENSDDGLSFKTNEGIILRIFPVDEFNLGYESIIRSGSESFNKAFTELISAEECAGLDVKEIFQKADLPEIPAFLREDAGIFERFKQENTIIQQKDIRGIIHSHSNWSDGSNTIDELAQACLKKGMEYLVISDHSKSAFYANGLTEERIRQQHIYVDQINAKSGNFKIFKGIESDILNDGRLDYTDEVLQTFDVVIASVHSNLKMTEEKATARLIAAIENPYTTILGHMTGRLLLSRNGYPVNHRKVIDACIANNVAIELNAHPNRLDIDWREIGYALEKGAYISIDPDAHFIEGLDDVKYGVLVAQKAMLPRERNLSSMNRLEFESYLKKYKNRQV
ncbi:MAG: DNA polymerase/3'-5' exonuclease PolX [Chitinophagaceae bacterium]|nr:MAG: DNA polymerase/3'-5' exonuclease PolX [Chitinophagaceae bacterium]